MFRKVPLVENEYYHLYNRGNNKRTIFLDNEDRDRFIKLLYLCNGPKPIVFKSFGKKSLEKLIGEFDRGKNLTTIGAYCLMPNHFHLLVREIREWGISRFMQKLFTAYSMYFNKKYRRTGTLFEGRFRSSHVNNDNYLKYLFAYIHLNPVKLVEPSWRKQGIEDIEGAERYLGKYAYSSYLDYIGAKRPARHILNREVFPEYFESRTQFGDFISDWLAHEDGALDKQAGVVQ